jgi:LytS/YehU family sensor histidine kinase
VAEGRARQAESARLAQDLAEARLASLAAQVHPHFLFNALNTISSVMYDDPHRADAMISRLGDLLRSSLAHTGRPTVPIEEERRILGLYVDLMAARFGSRLRVSVACPEALSQALVPAFLLQPLVENAIKHHPMENASVAEVDVILGADAGRLVVTVEDNGRGLKSDEHGGVGLSNLRGRLRHLYGEEHDLRLENRPEGGLRVALRLPLRFADAPPGPESR